MNIVKPVGKFLTGNGSLLLTIGGSAGVIVTSFLTGKAVLKADKIMNEIPEDKLKTLETQKKLIPVYIPPVVSGALTITCIVACHLMNKKIQAGFLAAFGVAHTTLEAYRSKMTDDAVADVERQISEDKINAEIAKLLEERPSEEYELWTDDYRKRPYWARKCDILFGERELNNELRNWNISRHYGYTSLQTFYSHVVGDPEPADSIYGWCLDQLLEECDTDEIDVRWEENMMYADPSSGKQIPCNYIWFEWDPLPGYWNYESPWSKVEKKDSRN